MKNLRKYPKSFDISAFVQWTRGCEGTAAVPGKPVVYIGCSKEFGGPGFVWSPQDFYVVSIIACVMTTFTHLAEIRRLKFLSYECEGKGRAEMVDGTFQITSVELKPIIKVCDEQTARRVKRLIELADKICMITASTKTKVVAIPTILIEQKAT